MILVDTAIWADHIDRPVIPLAGLLTSYHVVMHPYVAGELLLGNLKSRASWAIRLDALPQILPARHNAVMQMIDDHRLFGSGIGYVDAHLLATCLIHADVTLWTRDKRLQNAAQKIGVAANIG